MYIRHIDDKEDLLTLETKIEMTGAGKKVKTGWRITKRFLY